MAASGPGPAGKGGRVCVGIIGAARGLKGEVRIRSFTARPEDVGAYGPVADESGGRRFVVTVTGRAGGQVVARIDGVGDRTAAERLNGTRLYVARSALPEPEDAEEFYHADLIGLAAEREGGGAAAALGTVTAVHDFGGGDVVEIAGADGRTLMVPFTRAAVPVVDVAGGRIVVAAAGLIDEGSPRDDGKDGE